jgi:hypothetical protein
MPFTQTEFKQTLCSCIAGFGSHLLKMVMRRPWPKDWGDHMQVLAQSA